MEKARLIVAFPLYNGAATLESALQCIADQSFRDFRAIIFENRSTDGSLAIATAFAARDPRFEVRQNPVHLSAIDNFMQVIAVAAKEGRFFCLRAHDDYSDGDYLEKLVAALDAHPDKLLAAGPSLRISPERRKFVGASPDIFDFIAKARAGRPPRSLQFPSDWVYGVFRSEAAEILLRRWPALGKAWSAASYTIAEFVMRDLVAYVPDTHFHFMEGSNSHAIYAAHSFSEQFRQRWRYTWGCYRVVDRLPALSRRARLRIWHMAWRDARRKTGYRLGAALWSDLRRLLRL